MENIIFEIDNYLSLIKLSYDDFTVHIDTKIDNSRDLEEILSLLDSSILSYSCMCFEDGLPFSYIENYPLKECILRNLKALTSLDKGGVFRDKYLNNGVYRVYLQK